MNLNYNILRADKNGMYCIEMVGYINRVQFRWNTKIKVAAGDWNPKQQKHKKNKDINKRLIELLNYATNYFLCDSPNTDGFKSYMDEKTGRTKVKAKVKDLSFFEVMNTIAENSAKRTNTNGEHIGESRVRLYKNFTKQLREFERDNNTKLTFAGFDNNVLDDLKEWLTTERQLSPNTLQSRFKMLRAMFTEAKTMGCDVNDDIKSYRVKGMKSENVVLTQREVDMICNYRCDSNRLQNVQDLFTIGVYTGLRFSDLSRLSDDKIHNGTFELHQQKTGGKIVIPLHPRVQRVLDERGLPHVISGQKYNTYLRELAKLAGVNEVVELKKTKGGKRVIVETEKSELISSHTCRRTFATFLYKNGVNPKLIMMLTGHKQLATFMNYIILDNNDAINAVRDCWSRTATGVV